MTILADLNTLLATPKTSHTVLYFDASNAVTAMLNPVHDFAFNYSTNVLYQNISGTWTPVNGTITARFVSLTTAQSPPELYYGVERNGIMINTWPPDIGLGHVYVMPDWATLVATPAGKGEIALINDAPYVLAVEPSAVQANWVSLFHVHRTLLSPALIDADLGTPVSGDLSNCFVPKIKQLVRNDTSATITKGQAVYVSGANGTNVLISLAQANAESTSSKTLGIVEADIPKNANGYVIIEGILSGLNTSAAINTGDPIWLSPTTAGGFVYGITNRPLAPYHLVYLGVVTRKNNNNGEIYIKVQNGYEMDELHDVAISTPQDMEVLQYDAANSLWKNKSVALKGQCTVTATAHNSTIPLYSSNQTMLYITANSTTNFTVNITRSASATLLSYLTVGQVINVSLAVTNSSPAYYCTSVQIDGSASGVTTKWQGSVPSAGNINSVDIYNFTVIKTNSSTFTVLASLSKHI